MGESEEVAYRGKRGPNSAHYDQAHLYSISVTLSEYVIVPKDSRCVGGSVFGFGGVRGRGGVGGGVVGFGGVCGEWEMRTVVLLVVVEGGVSDGLWVVVCYVDGGFGGGVLCWLW